MPYLLRGALIEYGGDFLGPIPNAVIFQFNPETISRAIQVPQRPTGGARRETTQAGDPPIEKISIKAEFNAADALDKNNGLARQFGVGPQLAALEKMAFPATKIGGLIGKGIEVIGDALGLGGSDAASQPIPREQYPRILFIWGRTRILPVTIESLNITEQQYDHVLNPVRAEVSLQLVVNTTNICSNDKIANGAMTYSNLAKEAQAILNLANTAELVADLIPF
jgi:hypothetical protein